MRAFIEKYGLPAETVTPQLLGVWERLTRAHIKEGFDPEEAGRKCAEAIFGRTGIVRYLVQDQLVRSILDELESTA